MNDREKVIDGLREAAAYFRSSFDAMYGTVACEKFRSWVDAIEHALALLKAQEPITGETSDGYHTFNELYHHRAVLFSVIVANYPDRAWKSKKHHDGTMYNGMFIVGIDTPDGQATYHYDIDPYWDMFKCRELDNAPEWDGHTPTQAIERIGKLKAQGPRVMTLAELEHAEVVYAEDKNKAEIISVLVNGRHHDHFTMIMARSGGTMHVFRPSIFDYGKRWRCWTSRPTEEQRKVTPWN